MTKKQATVFLASAVFALSVALPVKAFYLQMPNVFKSLGMTTGKTILAEEGMGNFINPSPGPMNSAPALQSDQKVEVMPQKPMNTGGGGSSGPYQPGNNNSNNGPMKSEGGGQGQGNGGDNGNNGPMGGSQNQMQPQQKNNNSNNGPMKSEGGGQGQGMGPKNQDGQDDSKMEAERQRNDDRQLRDMKRGAKDMERNLTQFERMVKDAEKKSIALPADVSENVAKVRAIIDGMKSASTMEEFSKFDFSEANEIFQTLEETRRTVYEGAQRMTDMRRNMKSMEQGLTQFEKQINKLTKQNIVVPQETKDTLEKIKTIVVAVKDAKSWDEMQSAGIDDLQDLMGTLQEQQSSLQRLSQWPQMSKQMDRELNRLTQGLKRSKTMVDRLSKKGIDLASVYAEFESAVAKLKSVRDDVTSKMSAGQAEDAFDAIENDFFGQMDDTGQYQRTIEIMSNLSSFSADFKRGIADADRTVRNLRLKKIDTSELTSMIADAKVKGQEVMDLIKAKPIDEEVVLSKIQELEDFRVDFENKVEELTGVSSDQSWNTQGSGGQMNFQAPQLPSGFSKMMPKKEAQPTMKQEVNIAP